MPVGKPINECLQALGVLEKKSEVQTKTQWPQNAKILNEALIELANSIEEESYARGIGESLSKWVEDRAAEWVQSYGEYWSTKDRLPDAPVFPGDKLIIVYWIQQYVLNKLDNAARNRKKRDASKGLPLPDLDSHGLTTTQILGPNSLSASTQDIKQVDASKASSQSQNLDGWSPDEDSEPDGISPTPAATSISNPFSTVTQSLSNATVHYADPDMQVSQANDPSHYTPSGTSSANVFRARTYPPVIFQVEVSARITFLIGPSVTRDGHGIKSYARVMGFEEAHDVNTFRAGVLERLGEMGEVVGSRKLVARPDRMPMAFVINSEQDHHFLLENLKAWGKSKVLGPCIVHVSLEHEV